MTPFSAALKKIDTFLIENLIISKNQLIHYQQLVERNNSTLLFELYQQKIISDDVYLTICSHAFSLSISKKISIEHIEVDLSVLTLDEIKKIGIIPTKSDDKNSLILYDPSHFLHLNFVKLRCKKKIEYQLIKISEFLMLLKEIEINLAFKANPQSLSENKNSIIHLEENQLDSLIAFINQVLCIAISKHASDIHIEPYQACYRIRIRVNGLLEELKEVNSRPDKRITSRLKVLANLDTTERRLPQDGQLQISYNNMLYNLRLSTCPTVYGEKIVLRILYPQHHDLDSLGMTPSQKNNFISALKKSHGLILVCGPTGSGKTATLYAALDYINQPHINLVSVEDPVEMHLSGINQVSVNPSIKLSFQIILRAFLRQDPDVIMIGEIRDKQTAKIAIKAAQTGHLVLSTLHSASALKACARLRHIGIEIYDLIDSISLIISQRLVRALCPHCKKKYIPNQEVLQQFGFPADIYLYKAVGCDTCQNGYQHRFALFEFVLFNDEIINAILKHRSMVDLENALPALAKTNLHSAAIDALKAGKTSVEEVIRVIG